ncbi:MAG: hypothetical protein IJV41_01295 [Oscillospiraceae bacterium]|nr:hypothetical protein [Oscillospiraceae bacterium]
MIQFRRHAAFTQRISFDVDPASFTRLRLTFKQGGRLVLEKDEKDLLFSSHTDDRGKTVYDALVTLTGNETAAFSPYKPAYAQVVGYNGERVDFSEVEEIDVVDVLHRERG